MSVGLWDIVLGGCLSIIDCLRLEQTCMSAKTSTAPNSHHIPLRRRLNAPTRNPIRICVSVAVAYDELRRGCVINPFVPFASLDMATTP
jgi:hypothetical protein